VEKAVNAFPQVALSSAYGAKMPGGDGRAGMIAIISEGSVDQFNFKGFAHMLQSALPAYAVPKFIRMKTDLEYTATHKIKKFESKKEGFNPVEIEDPLYVLLPGESEYQLLTADIYADIMDNKYKF
jgi:acyl-CoA synthetase (AMP-forming)/AMP-acid ligase II